MGERGGKVVNGLIEIISRGEMGEVGGKIIYGLIEMNPSGEMSERGWKFVNGLIELGVGRKGEKGGRKVVNWLVEIVSKTNRGERRREFGYLLIKRMSKNQFCKGGRKINRLIERISNGEVSKERGKLLNG